MSLSEFHEKHDIEIVENDKKRYVAIALIVFGFVTIIVSIATDLLIFLLFAFAALIYGAISFDKTKKKARRLQEMAKQQEFETLVEAVNEGEENKN